MGMDSNHRCYLPKEVLGYGQAHSPLCHPCTLKFWRRVQELNPLTPGALTLTGFQDQRLTDRPTLRCCLLSTTRALSTQPHLSACGRSRWWEPRLSSRGKGRDESGFSPGPEESIF